MNFHGKLIRLQIFLISLFYTEYNTNNHYTEQKIEGKLFNMSQHE